MTMPRCAHLRRTLLQLTRTLLTLLYDSMRFLGLCLRPNPTLAAENLFLRKQLAMYQERDVKPKRTTSATRVLRRMHYASGCSARYGESA